ncbi:tumor necrosis factor receptor superfamily member 5 isoform X2 [Antennarius striatus]|uniref:tumor necrosis factor receptor superfamily member 5 isoform X2 n=1 Tax=Antennarius striatus TaxID=241820 RepID=UPI0035B173BB
MVGAYFSNELTHYDGRECKMCPAGQFQKSCTECKPCPEGSYTTQLNREERCHWCSGDCRPVFHLKVVQSCTSTSNVKCVCEDGFRCTDRVSHSAKCRYCERIKEINTTEAQAIISGEDKHTPSSASPERNSISAKPCQFPKCGSQSVGNGTQLKTDSSIKLSAILCPVVVVGCLALVILYFVCNPRDESCFKKGIAMVASDKGCEGAPHKSKKPIHWFSRDSFSTKQQQQPSLPAANLGPVHVHNPRLVIFSLINQFTGQVGSTIEGGKTAEKRRAKEDEGDCPVFPPTSSPSVHPSEEEQNEEADSILFPSQEQGKDCHLSREEVL